MIRLELKGLWPFGFNTVEVRVRKRVDNLTTESVGQRQKVSQALRQVSAVLMAEKDGKPVDKVERWHFE